MNEIWIQNYPQSYCVFEAGGCSDHQRCRIIIKTEMLKPRKPFQDFAKMSDLNISLEKSTLFLAGVKSDDSVSFLEQFPFEAGDLPVRYLGLPLLTKKMNVQDYSPLIARIRTRISSWTARHLSFAGRLQLIGSVIYSITNFGCRHFGFLVSA